MKVAQYTKSTTVSMQPELFDKIKRITDEQKISISQWFRAAADQYLKNSEKEKSDNDE
jgi:metal-responsive CopG/Arc/MetJ family transcriptional regulator